jgi:hypothetical protein
MMVAAELDLKSPFVPVFQRGEFLFPDSKPVWQRGEGEIFGGMGGNHTTNFGSSTLDSFLEKDRRDDQDLRG